MKAFNLIGVLMWGLGLAVVLIKPELRFSQMLHGREVNLGPYDGKVEIGVLPERYPHETVVDKKASNRFRMLLELLRGVFPIGIYDIPPLDPYIIQNLPPVNINLPFLTAELSVAKIIVTGLQAFKIELIELRMDTLRSDFILTVPLLNGTVCLQVNLELGGLFPITVNGTLRVKLQNITVNGAVGGSEITSSPKKFYTLKSLQAHIHVTNVRISIDGLNLEKDILESLESVDSLGSSLLREPFKKDLNYYIASEILKQMNKIIENFSVEQIKALLAG